MAYPTQGHPDVAPQQASLLAEAGELWTVLRDVAAGWLELFSLEGRLAALSLARIVAIALFMAITAAAVWFALMTALTLWLVGGGVAWPVAFLAVAASSAAAVGIGYWVIRRLSRNLLFRATRAQLAGDAGREIGANVHP